MTRKRRASRVTGAPSSSWLKKPLLGPRQAIRRQDRQCTLSSLNSENDTGSRARGGGGISRQQIGWAARRVLEEQEV